MYKSSGGQKERPGESCQAAVGDRGRFGEGEELAQSDSAKERSGHSLPGARWDHAIWAVYVATWRAERGLGK